MFKHTQTGAKGEQIAVNFLKEKGYEILHTNWRLGKKEIDIIALVNDMLVFAEVKTRRNFDFGFPEEAVTPGKERYLKAAADGFLDAHPHYQKIRFDIISIVLKNEELLELRHFEDAFF